MLPDPEPVPVLPEPVPVLPEPVPVLPEPVEPEPVVSVLPLFGLDPSEPDCESVVLPEPMPSPVPLALLGSLAGWFDPPQPTALKPSAASMAAVFNRIIEISSS